MHEHRRIHPIQEANKMSAKSHIALLAAVALTICLALVSRPSTAFPADSSDESQIRAVLDMQTAA